MKNPGYIVKPQRETKTQFVLQSTSYATLYYETLESNFEKTYSLEPPSLNIVILEIQDNLNFVPVLDEDNFVPAAWGFYSKYVKK